MPAAPDDDPPELELPALPLALAPVAPVIPADPDADPDPDPRPPSSPHAPASASASIRGATRHGRASDCRLMPPTIAKRPRACNRSFP